MPKHTYFWPVFLLLLLAGCQSPQEKANEQLIQAVRHWEYDDARAALAAGANPNAVSEKERPELGMREGQSIIEWAVTSRCTPMVKLLAEHGGDVRARRYGESALEHLIYHNEIDAVRKLLERDPTLLAPTHPPSIDTNWLLEQTLTPERYEIAKLLLRYGAPYGLKINVAKLHNWFAGAAINGMPEQVRFLLKIHPPLRKPEVLRQNLARAEQSRQAMQKYTPRPSDRARLLETITLLRRELEKSR